MTCFRPTITGNKRLRSMETAFNLWKGKHDQVENSAIYELFRLYEEILLDIDDSDSVTKQRAWKKKYQLVGIKAHQLFHDLAEKEIHVVFSKRLLKNRIETSKCGPQELPFFLHLDVVEDLLRFILLGASR